MLPTTPPTDREPPAISLARRGEGREVRRQHRLLTGMAARQHGVVSRAGLLAVGFGGPQIDRLIAAEWLHRLHAGVYHVGHPQPTRIARHLAATMGVGGLTGVSHRPGVVLRGVIADDGALIQVTTATGRGGERDGVRIHESRGLRPGELTGVQGVPTVRLERALIEVAGSCSPKEFARVWNAMDRKRLIDPLLLAGQLRRGRTGSAAVRARLDAYAELPPTESELEELFLTAVIGAYGLPMPVPQSSPLPHRVLRVDFAWPHVRVIVEIDGRTWHAIQSTWGEDHERDLALRLAGWRPLRYTHHQLTHSPELVATDLGSALT